MSSMEYHFNYLYQNLNDPRIQSSQALTTPNMLPENSEQTTNTTEDVLALWKHHE